MSEGTASGEQATEVKINTAANSKWLNRFLTFCMTLITGCVMTMCGFIWNLRSDFATEQEKTKNISNQVTNIAQDVKETKQSIEDIKIHQTSQDGRIQNIEHALKINTFPYELSIR